jgi:dTDP-4-dehydrorhamnose reductase
MQVAVLGASGMLGSTLLSHLAARGDCELRATVRDAASRAAGASWLPAVRWTLLDAETAADDEIRAVVSGAAWAINAIGVIKPHIRDDRAADVERATLVNALFPHRLARAAETAGCRVLQIATDCVFSGARGGSREGDRHDPADVYGKTKSLGEVRSPQVHHLRCSIVGPEARGFVSLLEWFRRQPRGAGVAGFTNHRWNGVTTLHFARLCAGVMRSGVALPHVQHVLPADRVTKCELLGLFARAFGREDVAVRPTAAPEAIDRTLGTSDPALNGELWRAAGYGSPPTVGGMIDELAAFEYAARFA